MKLRHFSGADAAEAMAAARATLGPEALLLDQRRVGGLVEITAAIDTAEEEPPAAPDLLARHGVPAPLARLLAASPLALPSRFRFAPLPAGPVMLLGPPGAGKTLAVTRLATAALLAGETPRVATTDFRRAGNELAALLAVLGLVPQEAPAAATITDTEGVDIFAPCAEAGLPATTATRVLVLPADLDPATAAELARAWREAGCTHMIATRLDLTPRLGALLAAADAARLVLSLASLSPATGTAMTPLSPAFLARRLARAPVRRHLDA